MIRRMSEPTSLDFKALLILNNRLMRDLEPRMRKYGLSTTGFLVLLEIDKNSGRGRYPHTRAALTRRMGLTPGSMSVLIGRMIRLGWVTEDRLDDRSKGLAITTKGKSVLHGGMVAWEDAFSVLEEGLSDTMKNSLLKAVAKINLIADHRESDAQRERYLRTIRKHGTKTYVQGLFKEKREAQRSLLQALDEG